MSSIINFLKDSHGQFLFKDEDTPNSKQEDPRPSPFRMLSDQSLSSNNRNSPSPMLSVSSVSPTPSSLIPRSPPLTPYRVTNDKGDVLHESITSLQALELYRAKRANSLLLEKKQKKEAELVKARGQLVSFIEQCNANTVSQATLIDDLKRKIDQFAIAVNAGVARFPNDLDVVYQALLYASLSLTRKELDNTLHSSMIVSILNTCSRTISYDTLCTWKTKIVDIHSKKHIMDTTSKLQAFTKSCFLRIVNPDTAIETLRTNVDNYITANKSNKPLFSLDESLPIYNAVSLTATFLLLKEPDTSKHSSIIDSVLTIYDNSPYREFMKQRIETNFSVTQAKISTKSKKPEPPEDLGDLLVNIQTITKHCLNGEDFGADLVPYLHQQIEKYEKRHQVNKPNFSIESSKAVCQALSAVIVYFCKKSKVEDPIFREVTADQVLEICIGKMSREKIEELKKKSLELL